MPCRKTLLVVSIFVFPCYCSSGEPRRVHETPSASTAPAWWKVGMPPYEVAPDQVGAFTLQGRVPLARMYVDDSNGGLGTHYKADTAMIDSMAERFRQMRKRLRPVEPKWAWFLDALKEYPVEGQAVAVVGSIEPTAEAMLLAHGARHVTTIEYNRLSYDHINLTQTMVTDVAALSEFDAVVSLSSFDHSGLGRYGDPVDADGDLKAMAMAQRLLKPLGMLFLTVPIGPDVVVWNLHRRYGAVRLPLLLQGWEVLRRFGWEDAMLHAEASWLQSYEPVHVLQPPQLLAPQEHRTDL